MMQQNRLVETTGGVKMKVTVVPRASRSQLAGWAEDRLRVRLAAPPVDGEANQELVRFLAHSLGVPRSKVHIVTGQTSRHKMVLIEGLKVEEMARILNC